MVCGAKQNTILADRFLQMYVHYIKQLESMLFSLLNKVVMQYRLLTLFRSRVTFNIGWGGEVAMPQAAIFIGCAFG